MPACLMLLLWICSEKEAFARAHARALEAAKQAAADERTAWRAAVTERLKRQAADREDKLRAELLKQRDEQLQVMHSQAVLLAVQLVHACSGPTNHSSCGWC